jgi:hypothetical protein
MLRRVRLGVGVMEDGDMGAAALHAPLVPATRRA